MNNNQNNFIIEDFQIESPKDELEEEDLEYENELLKDIENHSNFSEYVDKLELRTDYTDDELLQKSKEEIISYKNDQIMKLKSYITSLEKEKDDLIDNFKETTSQLLERLKDLESKNLGFRPQTPMIAKNLNKKSGVSKSDFPSLNNNKNNNNNKISSDSNNSKIINKEKSQRCPNCGKIFLDSEFLEHSLQCLRKVFHCKKCGELIEESKKKIHLESFRKTDKMINCIIENDVKTFKLCIDHGFKLNQILLEKTGDYTLHYICQENRIEFLKLLFIDNTNEYKIDLNIQNLNKENSLFTAIYNKSIDCAKFLINKGIEVNLRNKSDMSPLMLCCKFGYSDIIEDLLKHNANINEKNILGETPLKIAQMYNHEDLTLLLLGKFNANIVKKNPKKEKDAKI